MRKMLLSLAALLLLGVALLAPLNVADGPDPPPDCPPPPADCLPPGPPR